MSESRGLANRLKSAGKQVELVTVSQGGHYDSMISEGIPRGITWLNRMSGLKPASSGPSTRPQLTDLADARADAPGTSDPNDDPFAESSGQTRETADEVKTLMSDRDKKSGPELREAVEDIVKQGRDDTSSDAKEQPADTDSRRGTSAFDEDPFAESTSPRSNAGRSSPAKSMTADSGTDESPFKESPFKEPSTTDAPSSVSASGVDQLISQVMSENSFKRRDALTQLAKIDPQSVASDETRTKVIEMLNEIVVGDSSFVKTEAVKALGKWGDASSARVLLGALADRGNLGQKDAIYTALGQLKDPHSAMAVAERLGDFFDRDKAEACLREMGPVAEDALIILAPSQNEDVCLRALKLLGDVGTDKCMTVLRQTQRSRNLAVRETAKLAMRKVRLRQDLQEEDEEGDE